MPDPAFSVVIPSCNRANLLDRALKSVRAQTFQDFEVIIADDGSTDNTPDLIERWRIHFEDRLSTLWLDHGGAAMARNAGIAVSRGRAVAFLDSDDEWLPQHLEVCHTALLANPEAGMIFTDHIIQSDARIRTQAPLSGSLQELVRNIILRRVVIATPSVVVRRDVFGKVGTFNKELNGTEDWECWSRIAVEYPVAQVSSATVVIYQHPDNFSRDPVALERQLWAAVGAICKLKILSYCSKEEVKARAYLDMAEFYAQKAFRGRAMLKLGMAAIHSGKIMFSRDFHRVMARIALPLVAYRLIRKRVSKGVAIREGYQQGAMDR
jgi:glycosyltransferase involved in cell wall biosynthesis